MQQTEQTAPVAFTSLTPPRCVPMHHPAIAGHFPGNPIVPGVVILSHVTNAIARQLPGIVLGKLLSMRFHAPLRPGQSFTVVAQVRGNDQSARVHVEVREDGGPLLQCKLIAAGQWATGVDILTTAD